MHRQARLSALILVAMLPLALRAGDRDAEILFKQARSAVDADSAASLYKSLLENFPRDTTCSWALLRLAQYCDARGDQAHLEEYVSRLREMFPHSLARREAASLLPERAVDNAANDRVAPRTRKSTPPVATPPPTPAPAAASGAFSVQLGAFSVRENAEKMRKLAAGTYPTAIVARDRGGKTLYCVIAGTFSSQADADRAVDRLERATGAKGVVVPR